MEHSKSYHCLQIQLHCDLRKTLGKNPICARKLPFANSVRSDFEGCTLLGGKLWAVSVVVLQKFRLAVQKYLQKPLATTGASSSLELPCLQAEGGAGRGRAGVIISFWRVWWRYPPCQPSLCRHLLQVPSGVEGQSWKWGTAWQWISLGSLNELYL